MSGEIAKQSGAPLTGELLTPERDPRGGNAQRHGILSEHVPSGEREAYAAHVQAVRESSGARGYLQERLADRAALALWRLDRVARYEAAVSSVAQREAAAKISEGTPYGPAGAVMTAHERLRALTGETVEAHRADPTLSEAHARQREGQAAHLEHWAAGGSAEGLTEREAAALGFRLFEVLEGLDMPYGRMVRAMLGRAPRRGEADTLADGEWRYEPGEVVGLLALFVEHLGEHAPGNLAALAQTERRAAARIREAQREAEAAQTDALTLSALPQVKELEKVTRYEAHLERVLYRALHDLEAARREGEGRDTPGPLRGVLDVSQGEG